MSQRTKVVGARTPVIWLLIAISLIVIAALAVGGLVIYPQMQKQQAEQARVAEAEQHYQAGMAFQNVGDSDKSAQEYEKVIVLDANYKDVQSRLAEVKAHLAGSAATATAVAMAEAGQVQATTAAGPTATAAALEVHYQKGLGYMNMSQWAEAKTEFELVFAADPNYKEVQAKLTEVRNKLSELALLTPTPTSVPLASPTPRPTSVAVGVIPFSALGDPQTLNPVLGWQPGGSAASAYDLTMNPGALTIIAGPETKQWKSSDSAPLIAYSIHGNFEAQVRLAINSIQDSQYAGLGVRSAQIHTTWVRLERGMEKGEQNIWADWDQQGSADILSSSPYTDATIWLKLVRGGSLFTLSYSANGSNWITLEKDFVFEMPIDTEIYLYAMSNRGDKGVVTQFYNFKVLPK